MSRVFTRCIFFCPLHRLMSCLFVCFLLCICLLWLSDLMVSVTTDLSGIGLADFHFSVLSEWLHAALYSLLECLDKQLRESTVFNTTKRHHSIFLKEDVWDCCTGASQWYSQVGRKKPYHVLGDLFYCSLLFFKYSVALELSVGPIIC